MYLWRVLSERPWAAPAAPGHTRKRGRREEREEKKGGERRKNHLVIIVYVYADIVLQLV